MLQITPCETFHKRFKVGTKRAARAVPRKLPPNHAVLAHDLSECCLKRRFGGLKNMVVTSMGD